MKYLKLDWVIWFILISVMIVNFCTFWILNVEIHRNRDVGQENQALIKSTACILAIPAVTRTQANIDACHIQYGVK